MSIHSFPGAGKDRMDISEAGCDEDNKADGADEPPAVALTAADAPLAEFTRVICSKLLAKKLKKLSRVCLGISGVLTKYY